MRLFFLFLATLLFHKAVSFRLSRTTARPSSSRLQASLQFKNVNEMLDTFSQSEEPVLLAFTAINCGPCRLQRKELATARKDLNLIVATIDTNKFPDVGSRFEVGALPTLVAFQGDKVLLRMEGLTPAETIIQSLQNATKNRVRSKMG